MPRTADADDIEVQRRLIAPGDRVELNCVFDNSPEHQPIMNGERPQPRDLNWGEGSFDEMCESTLLVVPN